MFRLLRPRRPLGATYAGLLVIGLLGSGGLGLLSAVMFLDRPLGEILINVIVVALGAAIRGRAAPVYQPEDYYLWAGFAAFMALLWGALSVRAILAKPQEDRRLDAAIKSRLVHSARGAPLEPEQ